MDAFDKIKKDLDTVLQVAPPNVGIAFGSDVFKEFQKRGWLSLEKFGVLGTVLFSEQPLPAYGKTHCVFVSWGIDAMAFQVGKAQA